MFTKFLVDIFALCVIIKVSNSRLQRDDPMDVYNTTKTVQDLRNPWIDPPSIRSAPGHDDFIQCSVTSNSPVAFEWRKNGHVINESIYMSTDPSIGLMKIIDLKPIEKDNRNSYKIYRSVLRFLPLTIHSNGSYSCLIYGPGYEKTETVPCLIYVSESFHGNYHVLTNERKFLIGAIIFIFSILFLGTILVTILSFKLWV